MDWNGAERDGVRQPVSASPRVAEPDRSNSINLDTILHLVIYIYIYTYKVDLIEFLYRDADLNGVEWDGVRQPGHCRVAEPDRSIPAPFSNQTKKQPISI